MDAAGGLCAVLCAAILLSHPCLGLEPTPYRRFRAPGRPGAHLVWQRRPQPAVILPCHRRHFRQGEQGQGSINLDDTGATAGTTQHWPLKPARSDRRGRRARARVARAIPAACRAAAARRAPYRFSVGRGACCWPLLLLTSFPSSNPPGLHPPLFLVQVYRDADLVSPPARSIQTVLVPPGAPASRRLSASACWYPCCRPPQRARGRRAVFTCRQQKGCMAGDPCVCARPRQVLAPLHQPSTDGRVRGSEQRFTGVRLSANLPHSKRRRRGGGAGPAGPRCAHAHRPRDIQDRQGRSRVPQGLQPHAQRLPGGAKHECSPCMQCHLPATTHSSAAPARAPPAARSPRPYN